MKFPQNIGPATRVLYVVAGAGFVALGFWAPYLSGVWSVLVGLFGAIVMVEGLVGF